MKKTASFLYSSIGVVAMFVLLVAICFLAGRFKHRVDLTAEKAFTLSPGTKAILAKLDTPVQIRFYCTQGENTMPVFLKTYAQRVEDLLGEFKRASKFVEIQKLDPQPDSDAEDSAKLDGVEGQVLQQGQGDRLFLGLSVSMLDQKQAIPFLSPDRERLLEYDIARAISRVATTEKPVVGVMSPLPIAGTPMNPMMMQMQQRGQAPWVLYSELKQDFALKKVEMTTDSIPEEIKVLLLVHPKGLSDATQYALDQFVLRGGKLIAFLDPLGVLRRGELEPDAGPVAGPDLGRVVGAAQDDPLGGADDAAALLGRLGEEEGQRRPQRVGESLQGRDRGLDLAALDIAHQRRGHAGFFCQFADAVAMLLAELGEAFADRETGGVTIACDHLLTRAHGPALRNSTPFSKAS